MPDPDLSALNALRRLRHAETDMARRDLAEALSHEVALAERHSAVRREIQAARQFSGTFDREAFAAWFGRMRSEHERLAGAMREAATKTSAARTALAHRRVAETAAEAALAEAVAVRRIAAEHREQVMLEDVARALKRSPG
jgi:hypothetical protein